MSTDSNTIEISPSQVDNRDAVSEMLSRLTFLDWVRIWSTKLPRHLPRRLARQVQDMNTELGLRGITASSVLGIPTWVAVVFVMLPDTPRARTWAWAPLLVVLYTGTVVPLMWWLRRHHRLTAGRYNLIMLPSVVYSALVWATLPYAVGVDGMGRFYLAVVTVSLVSVTGLSWMVGHWPLAVLYSAIIGVGITISYYALELPEAAALAAMSGVLFGSVFMTTVVGCVALVRSQLQTVMTYDRQAMIDMLLRGYEQGGNDWVWAVDEDTVFHSIPDRMSAAGRGDPRIVPGRSLAALVAADPVASDAIRDAEPFDATIKTSGSDGEGEIRLWGRPNIVNGRLLGFHGVGSDVGAAKRAIDAGRAADRFDAMVAVTSGINHDFNNQLATVLGAVELAKFSVQGLAGPVEYLDRAKEACLRSRSLTADLAAALGLKSPSEAVPFDLANEVKNVIGDVAASYPEMDIRLDVVGRVVAVADPSHVRRSVRNLLDNACQANTRASQSNREVLVGVGVTEHDDTQLARVRVSDCGEGVGAELVDRIFEPFFTTRGEEGGTGLGLAVARGLCRQAGGSLRLVSSGRGSTFEMTVPSSEHSDVDALAADASVVSEGAIRAGRYLLVEDDDLVATTMIDWIETNGASATWVRTVGQAEQLLGESGESFECLISDVLLPDGEGFDVAAAFRACDPKAPVVYVSGFSRSLPGDLDALLHAPFVAKPFEFVELLRALRAAGVAVDPATPAI